MIPLFIYSVTVFGLAFIVGQSQISLPFRQWLSDTAFGKTTHGKWLLELIECPACFSFWCGLVFALALPAQSAAMFQIPLNIKIGFLAAVVAVYSCGISAIIGLLTKLMSVPTIGMEDSDPSLLEPEDAVTYGKAVNTSPKVMYVPHVVLRTPVAARDTLGNPLSPSNPPWISGIPQMTEEAKREYWEEYESDKMTYEEFCNPLIRPTQKRE